MKEYVASREKQRKEELDQQWLAEKVRGYKNDKSPLRVTMPVDENVKYDYSDYNQLNQLANTGSSNKYEIKYGGQVYELS